MSRSYCRRQCPAATCRGRKDSAHLLGSSSFSLAVPEAPPRIAQGFRRCESIHDFSPQATRCGANSRSFCTRCEYFHSPFSPGTQACTSGVPEARLNSTVGSLSTRLSRASGTSSLVHRAIPALKCWASLTRTSGTSGCHASAGWRSIRCAKLLGGTQVRHLGGSARKLRRFAGWNACATFWGFTPPSRLGAAATRTGDQ